MDQVICKLTFIEKTMETAALNSNVMKGVQKHEEEEPLQLLFQELNKILSEKAESSSGFVTEVKEKVSSYIRNHNDWREYAHFNSIKYARNLVATNELVEIIILCWLENQESPIHDHGTCFVFIFEFLEISRNLETEEDLFKRIVII